MFTPSTSENVTGSGHDDHVPPKKSGWKIMSASDSQPPVDPPESHLAHGSLITRYRFSISGINSFMIASPYGPMFTLFTAYESSKYGVGCWNVTAIMRGKFSDNHESLNAEPPRPPPAGSNPYGAPRPKCPWM